MWSNLHRVFCTNRTYNGTLVAIAGYNGSGKTTQVAAVARKLRELGRKVVETRQPTEWYRRDITVSTFQAVGGLREQARILALFGAADRLRHVYEVVTPALNEGAIVLCERYIYAHFAVFAHRGLDVDFITTINMGIPKPDLAFYLDVPPSKLFERLTMRNRGQLAFEESSLERITAIVENYNRMMDQFVRLDGLQRPEIITETIVAAIMNQNDRR